MQNFIQVTDSKCISGLGYDEKQNNLYVKFKDSPVYSYPNVSKDIFEMLKRSKTKGKLFHQIKKSLGEPNRLDN